LGYPPVPGFEFRPAEHLGFESPQARKAFGQAVSLVQAARSYGLYAYVVLVHVDLAGDTAAEPPVLPMSTSCARYVPTGYQDEEVPAFAGLPGWRWNGSRQRYGITLSERWNRDNACCAALPAVTWSPSVARGATPERVVCVARCVSPAASCLVPTVTVITEPGWRALAAVVGRLSVRAEPR